MLLQQAGIERIVIEAGVATEEIVELVQSVARADRAYFGEKDYQQYLLIRGMAETLFHPTRIIACATVREPDGLAMSSRNRLLNAAQRRLAASFPKLLAGGGTPAEIAAQLRAAGFEVDYVAEQFDRRFGAVRLGAVRLIDNIPLSSVHGSPA